MVMCKIGVYVMRFGSLQSLQVCNYDCFGDFYVIIVKLLLSVLAMIPFNLYCFIAYKILFSFLYVTYY